MCVPLHGYVCVYRTSVCVHIHSAQWLSTESQSKPGLHESPVLRREGADSASPCQDGRTPT